MLVLESEFQQDPQEVRVRLSLLATRPKYSNEAATLLSFDESNEFCPD